MYRYSKSELEKYVMEASERIFERAIAEGSLLYDPAGGYFRTRCAFQEFPAGIAYEADIDLRITLTSRHLSGAYRRGPRDPFSGGYIDPSSWRGPLGATAGSGSALDAARMKAMMDAMMHTNYGGPPRPAPMPKVYSHPYYEWVDKNA